MYCISSDLFAAMYETVVETGMKARRRFPNDQATAGEFAGMLTMLMFVYSQDDVEQRKLYVQVQSEVMNRHAIENLS